MALFQNLALTITGNAESAQQVLEETQDAVDQFNENITNSAKNGLKIVGAAAATGAIAIGAALGKGVMENMNLEAGNAKLAAQLGATAEEAGRYGKIAGELYRDNYGESIGDLNDIIKSVVQNIGPSIQLDDASLQAISATLADFGVAFEADAGEMSRAIGSMLKTGMASTAEEALDILTTGFQNGTNAADDLLDTFNEYGTQFRQLGLDGKDALGLLSQGLKAGSRDADVVADSFKELAIRVAAGDAADGIAILGLNADQMAAAFKKGGPEAKAALTQMLDGFRAIEDPSDKTAVAMGLFGTKAEDMQAALNSLDVNTAASSLGEVAGAATRMGDTLNDTALGRIESFKRNIEMNLVEFVGDKVIPLAQELYAEWAPKFQELFETRIKPLIAQFSEWWTANAPAIKEAAIGIGEGLLNAAMKVAEAVAWVGEHWDTIGPILGAIGSLITDNLMPILAVLGGVFIANAIQTVASFVMVQGALVITVAQHAAATAAIVAGWVVARLETLYIMGLYAADAIRTAATSSAAWITQHARMAAAAVVSWATSAASAVAGAATMALATLVAMAPMILMIAAVVAVAAAIAGAVYLIIKYWDEIVAATVAAWNWIKDLVVGVAVWIYEAFMKYSPVGLILSNWRAIVDFFVELPGKIWDSVSGFATMLFDAGKNIIIGLINGIKSMASAPWNALKGIGEDMIGGFKKLFGIHSPSRVFFDMGVNIDDGAIKGLEHRKSALVGTLGDIGNAMLAPVASSVESADWTFSAYDRPAASASASASGNYTWTGNIVVQGSNDPVATAKAVEAAMEEFFSGKVASLRQIRS